MTVLHPEQDEATARAEAAFRSRVLQAGAKYETPEGHILIPHGRYVTDETGAAPVEREVERPQSVAQRALEQDVPGEIVIDLDIDEVDDRIIWLRSKVGKNPDGTIEYEMTPLTIPAPKMDIAFKINRYIALINKTAAKLNSTTDDRLAKPINDQLVDLQRKLVRLVIPDMTDELMRKVNLRAQNEIVSVAATMVQESMSASVSPITYVRRIYRLIGEPNGATDRGMLAWLRDHFGEIETMFGEQDLPN